MLVVFQRIFVADRKIIYGYNFVAPLTPFSTSSKLYKLKLKWFNSFLVFVKVYIKVFILFKDCPFGFSLLFHLLKVNKFAI